LQQQVSASLLIAVAAILATALIGYVYLIYDSGPPSVTVRVDYGIETGLNGVIIPAEEVHPSLGTLRVCKVRVAYMAVITEDIIDELVPVYYGTAYLTYGVVKIDPYYVEGRTDVRITVAFETMNFELVKLELYFCDANGNVVASVPVNIPGVLRS